MFSIFSKKIAPKNALATIGVDMHSHLLPGLDDGLDAMEQTMAFAQELHELGYQKLICTPHILPGVHDNSPETILPVLAKAQQAFKEHDIPMKIEAAAEYMLDEPFQIAIKNKEKLLTFGDDFILIEMSYAAPSPVINQVIFDLKIQGYRPILAHPERYSYCHNDFDIYEEYESRGCLLQVNMLSLTGFYGKPVQKIAEQLIKKDMISFIGTDMHHPGHLQMTKQFATSPYLQKILSNTQLMNSKLL